MAKEALTLSHLSDGEVLRKLNDAIQEASQALDDTDNPKATAKVTLEIKLSSDTSGGNFRTVASAIKVTAPAPAAKKEIFPVNNINGSRLMTVDLELKDDQLQLPGVTSLADKRAAV